MILSYIADEQEELGVAVCLCKFARRKLSAVKIVLGSTHDSAHRTPFFNYHCYKNTFDHCLRVGWQATTVEHQRAPIEERRNGHNIQHFTPLETKQ